ncbi:MAG: hypothetical protein EPO25_17255 [Gammaproteobacteria bacterium]|nr:MAG: hypothetical protein EPO25_17255 [Gammaproteobacteria bacterium]
MRAVVATLALVAAAPALPQDDAGADPAARPSIIAPLAARSLLLDLARAGDRIFAVGERGHVLYSTDAGASWTQVQVPGSANLNAVHFADARHGCAVGHAGIILCTWDGGERWERAHFTPEDGQPLLDVWLADEKRGVAVGAYGTVLTTIDGGHNWASMVFEPAPLPGAELPPVAEDELDAGVDLGLEFHLNALAGGPGGALYLGAEAGRIFRSDDAGASWRELPSPYEGSFHGILPLDGEALLAFGLRGHLFRSDDGGTNWVQLATGTVALLTAGARLDPATVVISGMTGVLLISRDGGHSFALTQQDNRKAISAVLAGADGALIVAGESGVRRLPLPAVAP